MDTQTKNEEDDIVENQNEALKHLTKAVGKVKQSKESLKEEQTQEVRLEVEDKELPMQDPNPASSSTDVEKLEQRIEHLEATASTIAKQQQEIYNKINNNLIKLNQKLEEKSVDEENDTSDDESTSKNSEKLECNICGRDIGRKGFIKHIEFTHNINVKNMFKEDGVYKAEGLENEDFGALCQLLRKRSETNITNLVNQRIEDREEEKEDEEDDEELDYYACDVCGSEYSDKRGLASHLRFKHNIKGEGAVDRNIRNAPEGTDEEVNEEQLDESYSSEKLQCPFCDEEHKKTSMSRHISSNHEEETQMREFFYDEQKQAYCYRDKDRESTDFSKFAQGLVNIGETSTDIYLDALSKGYNSEQEYYEKELKENESDSKDVRELSDYEKAKRKASVSDRDMKIAEQAFHKIIHDSLSEIPDHKEKFISYTGNSNIPGFETMYEGDLSPLNMWRKLFSNTELIKGIEDRVGDSIELSWERKGASGTPQNWVVKVERTDR